MSVCPMCHRYKLSIDQKVSETHAHVRLALRHGDSRIGRAARTKMEASKKQLKSNREVLARHIQEDHQEEA